MQYGYFDLANKEYVITRPDTPSAWANYLGSPEYGAIISNNAGGYSFVKSGANGRITRYRFNSNMALPGRYIYLRDNDANDYWSASWQPVGKPLDTYKSTCRHGTAYTVISAEYSGIRSDVTYYVPDGATHEVWRAIITNNSDRPRNLSAFGFVEFTNEDNYEQDQVNLQYSLFISRTAFEQNKMMQYISEYSEKDATSRFFGMVGAPITAYNGSLEHFIGSYRTYSNPIAVESGHCDNELNYNSNSCGALQTELTLQPGESKELIFVLGRKTSAEADEILHTYETAGKVDAEVAVLKQFWHEKLNHFSVETPSEAFNNMINVWNAYQCFITFIWSRAASFIYCGLRNGYGYRDTVQDIQGIIHLDPELAAEKIRFMLSAQVDNGGGLPLVKFNHNAGHENTPDDPEYVKETGHPSYRADDALWLFPTIAKYVGESGNAAFYDEVIVYANGGEDTVYDHLKRAIQFSMERLGDHNMPAGLHADWNDCLRLGKKGESTFVAFQLYYAMTMMKKLAAERNDAVYVDYLEDAQAIGEIAHGAGAKYIMGVNPISLGIIKTPAEYGADVAVGDGQPLGLPLGFGGPYLGFMAATEGMMRKLPGRIVGQTEDHNGKTGYVLTLQAREQHIRREKASSNICSNQALCALAVGVYMSAMGSEGIKEAALQSASKAHYLAAEIDKIGFKVENKGEFFHEFVTVSEKCPCEALKALEEHGILGGYPLGNHRVLWCCTEMNTKEEMDEVVRILKEV